MTADATRGVVGSDCDKEVDDVQGNPPPPPSRSEVMRGILLLLGAVSLFAIIDGISKILAETHSLGQLMLARYALAVPVLLAMSPRSRWTSLLATRRPGQQILRALSPVCVGASMVLAVRYLPLADATAILFAGPFLVIVLSAPLLGERVGLASWIGVAVGFAAVLLVVRPGGSALSQYTVFPLVGAGFYAVFQLMTRWLAAAGEHPDTTLAWSLLTGLAVGAPLAAVTWVPPSPVAWLLMGVMGVVFGLAQALMARAYLHATASVLAPFTYVQVIAAALFGVVVLRTFPDALTLTGIAIIIAAGVLVVRQQGRAGPAVTVTHREAAQ